MAQMIQICEDFGIKNNLKFSTDDNPAKSKTKCLYMLETLSTLLHSNCMGRTCHGWPMPLIWDMSFTRTAPWTWTLG